MKSDTSESLLEKIAASADRMIDRAAADLIALESELGIHIVTGEAEPETPDRGALFPTERDSEEHDDR